MEQEQVQETTQEMTDPNTTNTVAIAMKKTAELNAHIEYLPNLLMAAYNEIVRLTAERDEARRMYCEEAFCHRFNERGGEATIIDSRQIAHSMGWDCFKEDGKPCQ